MDASNIEISHHSIAAKRCPRCKETKPRSEPALLVALLAPTAPPDREGLESILKCQINYKIYNEIVKHGGVDRFLNLIMAWAHPRPLRKENLEQIFRQHFRKYASPEEWQREIIEAIWRWAMGEKEKRCKECGQEIKSG